jgi:hypothetical protein
MGKLMKLITLRDFKNDPYKIKNRSKNLLKNYAKLSIPILAPTKNKKYGGRESMIVLSVNAGREEELISEMRIALSTLQEENSKLKQKVKVIFFVFVYSSRGGGEKLKYVITKIRLCIKGIVD